MGSVPPLEIEGAFVGCPLVVSFFKCLPRVAWDDYPETVTLLDVDGRFIRAVARVRLANLVDKRSRLGSEFVSGFSVVG